MTKTGVGDIFQRETRYRRGSLPRGRLDWASKPATYKRYPSAPKIRLREPSVEGGAPLWDAIRKRWCDVNALRVPDRAPIWCKPVGCWKEILPEEALFCRDPWLRGIERYFRRILFKVELDDDTPLPEFFPVRAVLDVEPPNIWGLEIQRHRSGDDGGAWGYEPALKSEADLDRLAMPVFRYNEARTNEAIERAHELLGEILPVRRVCVEPLNPTFSAGAALRGLSEFLMDMVTSPLFVHRLMAHLRDAALAGLDAVEAAGLPTPEATPIYSPSGPSVYSEPVGPEPEDGKRTFRNLWCAANSQEFDMVSPEMWEA